MTNLTAVRNRIQSIDVLRGIVMVIMALDHSRDFFHKIDLTNASSVATDPTNMATTTPALFFTRWITHFCAPIFVFLSGTSARLMSQRRTKKELSAFLIIRGFWLVLVELFIIGLGWTFDPTYHVFILQVIWAIGISMIILGLLIFLPEKMLWAIGLIIVFGHNILDFPSINKDIKGGFLADLIYFGDFSFPRLFDNRYVGIIYPFLPWTGVMILGYCFGKIYQKEFDPLRRRKILITIGSAITLLFIILRLLNIYGDPSPWGQQPRDAIFTFLSFLNTTKYPPSLLFLSMTIGPALLLLPFLEHWQNRFTRIMNIYGRVPMFFYIVHFYIIHTLVVIVFYLNGYTAKDIVTPNSPFLFRPRDFGFPLWGVYLVWIFVVIILYPLCKKYNEYKSTHRKWWLSYL